MRNHFTLKGNCSSPQHQHRNLSHLYHGNEQHTTCTHTDRAIAMASRTRATRSFKRVEQFTQQLTAPSVKPAVYHSLTLFISSLLFLQLISSVICQTNYLFSAEGKVSWRFSHTSGDRGKEALWESQEMPKRCPRMRLSRHRTHASTATINAGEISGSRSSSDRGGEENMKKKAREGAALSAAGALHHRLPLWKGGRGVDRGREVLFEKAHCLSLLQCMHNPKFNIYDLVTAKCSQWLESDL